MNSELAQKVQDALKELLGFDATSFLPEYTGDKEDPEVRRVGTFEDEGVMTMDKGLVVQLEDGSEVYLTIQTRTR